MGRLHLTAEVIAIDLMIAVITLISIVNSLTSKCDISALVHALPVLIEIRLCHISIL